MSERDEQERRARGHERARERERERERVKRDEGKAKFPGHKKITAEVSFVNKGGTLFY